MRAGAVAVRVLRSPRGRFGALCVLCLLLVQPARIEPQHACRFWGLIGTAYPQDLIADHLRDGTIENLKDLGGVNSDGWAFASFLSPTIQALLSGPLIRRGGPPANHPADPDYDSAVDELSRLRPRAVLGHVRRGTSGHWGIPNPHPFQHEGMIFAHNGSIPEYVLLTLLTRDDPSYLQTHPPDYVDGYIDSELYFLYLLKFMHRHPGLSRPEALRLGVRQLAAITLGCRLNFVLTQGDTLYALRCSVSDDYDPVRYLGAQADAGDRPEGSPYWVVASQVLGSTAVGWAAIPARTLAVFVPDRARDFYPVDLDTHEPGGQKEQADSLRANDERVCTVEGKLVPAGGASVTVEIWDVQGRLIRRDGPVWMEGGRELPRWDGRDARGLSVASGTYLCKVRVGERSWVRKTLVLR